MIAFKVSDMTCGHCVSTITRALKDADKDAKVQIDLASQVVQVESMTADSEELADAIREAGYSPTPVPEAAAIQVEQPRPRGGCCGSCR
jgi:copper chaperone